MSIDRMKQDILNSPMAEARGVERIKQMLERHDATFIEKMYELMVDDEAVAIMEWSHWLSLI